MAKHARYSPSSSERWMTCPGSIKLSEGLPSTSSQYADEGTAAHFLAEQCFTLGCDAIAFQGRRISVWTHLESDNSGANWSADVAKRTDCVVITNEFVVDADMAEAVQVYLDCVRSTAQSSGGLLFAEIQVPLSHITGEKDATGTSDTIILTDEEIIVVDLKYGKGVEVTALDNSQMLMYASGALRYIEDLVGGTERIKTVGMVISQPRISVLPSEWNCSVEELRVFEQEVKVAAAIAEDMRLNKTPVEFRVSEKGCRFCKAMARCPAAVALVEENLGGFTDLNAALAVTNTEDNALLSKHLAVIDFVENWCKAVRAEGESQLLQGNAVPGYKLVQGKKGNRSWLDEALAERTLKKLKLKRDEMYETKLISPTTAEKVIGNTSEKWKQVQNLIVQKEGGLSVAPESDKRPAIEVKPVTDGFTPLD